MSAKLTARVNTLESQVVELEEVVKSFLSLKSLKSDDLGIDITPKKRVNGKHSSPRGKGKTKKS